MCARAYALTVSHVECHRRNALVPKKGGWGLTGLSDLVPGPPPGGAIRCSPLVRERFGLGGCDARPGHGAMRDGLQAPGSTKSASRGVICELWGAQMQPSLASQVRSNGFPAGSAAVGASPFSPPTPEGRGVGVEREVSLLSLSKEGLGAGGLMAADSTRGHPIWPPGRPPRRCNPLQPARAGALRAGGLGRPARAWRDEGRAPGSGLYQELSNIYADRNRPL